MLAHNVAQLTLGGGFALFLALVTAGAAKGLIGVGTPIVAMPLVSHIIDLPAAVALLSIPLVLSNLRQAVEGGGTVTALRQLAPLLLGFCVGVVIGVKVLMSFDDAWLKPLVGAALLLAGLTVLSKPDLTLSPAGERVVAPIAGALGGVFGGIAALSGPIVYVYLLATSRDKNLFVKHASLYLVFASAMLLLVMSSYALLSLADAGISLMSVLPVMVGMALGTRIRPHVPIKVFRLLILLVVLASAAGLIVAPLLRPLA
ncbi:MAG: TSUP family transporter [Geminicoccaceae bacterium]|uniref:TSUP family transporter n=1 Tax=Reyranella sp. TaxID=1929291 RepID=UPI003D0F38C3